MSVFSNRPRDASVSLIRCTCTHTPPHTIHNHHTTCCGGLCTRHTHNYGPHRCSTQQQQQLQQLTPTNQSISISCDGHTSHANTKTTHRQPTAAQSSGTQHTRWYHNTAACNIDSPHPQSGLGGTCHGTGIQNTVGPLGPTESCAHCIQGRPPLTRSHKCHHHQRQRQSSRETGERDRRQRLSSRTD